MAAGCFRNRLSIRAVDSGDVPDVDLELADRLLPLLFPLPDDLVEGPGEGLLEEGGLGGRDLLPADVDDLGDPQDLVEGKLEPLPQPRRHPLQGCQGLLEEGLVDGEIPALGVEEGHVDVDLDPAPLEPLLAAARRRFSTSPRAVPR